MDGRYKRLGKNTIIVFLGRAGVALVGVLMLPFYTKWLTPEEYGLYDLIYTYATIALGLVTCCISDSIFVYPKSSDFEGKRKYFTSGLLFSVLAFVFCIFSFVGVSIAFKDKVSESIVFKWDWVIIGLVVSSFVQLYVQSFTRAIDQMRIYGLSGVIQTLSTAVVSVVLIPKFGLNGYFISIIISNFLAGIVSFVLAGAYKYVRLKEFDGKALKELLNYGLPLVPGGLMWWLINGFNKPIIEAEIGLSALGVFAVANKFPSLITLLYNIFANAWSISVIEEFDKPDFNLFFNKIVQNLTFVMIIGGCLLSSASHFLIKLITDSSYEQAWKYIPALIMGVMLQNLAGLIGGVFAALKKSKYILYSSLAGGGVSVVLTLLLIKPFGLYGVCIAIIFSFLVMLMLRIRYAWRYIDTMNLRYYLIMGALMSLYIITVIVVRNPLYKASIELCLLCLILWINKQNINKILATLKSFLTNRVKRC